MHAIVKSFKTYIVEGRFVSLFVSLVIVVMRAAMFSRGDTLLVVYPDTGYLWQYVAHWFADPMVSHASSTLSVFLIAGLISAMNHRFTLIRSRSSLPFTAPLFLLSLHPWFMVMRADYVAIIFVLIAFFPLLKSYQISNDPLFSFRSAILIGIASLFQIYALAMLPLWWHGEWSMRGPHFRSFLSSLFGLSLVYVSLFAQYFLVDDVEGFVRPFLSFAAFSLPQLPAFSLMEWGVVALAGLYFISNMVLSIRVYSRDKVLTLNFMQFVVFLIILQLLLQLLYWKETLFFLSLSIALISYLNAYFYTRTQSPAYIYLALLIVATGFLFYLSHFSK
ncbi:MAG: hypothetical protein LLF80_01660 [Porphyromonadaceae bacterium]|nr:hypothetical protein [Porphyromonadaceae bacterium]